ncbi:MAG: PEGA domain-containing protein [Candidatus Staskawiczbacteria bacterium]|nr:PEGA domain-containing protein [Candidatus Staskawiczbacteria bacterium]
MTKRARLLILVFCAVLFFVVAPYIIIDALGYKFDFEQKKIVATGGIYVKALPLGANITIDSKISNKTSFLSPTVFVQNLLPKQHNILIKKEGYFDYRKNLQVKEKEVTKLEKVILFKEKISFEILTNKADSPFLKKELETTLPISILKKVLAFDVLSNNIIWLDQKGNLNSTSQDGKTTEKLSQIPLKIIAGGSYKLKIISQKIFLLENNNLLLFDPKTKTFEIFYSPAKDLKVSPDGQKILYCNDNEILYSYLNSEKLERIFLNRFSGKIGDCFWLNDDYLIFNLDGKIVISETDNRDNTNIVTLQQAFSPTDKIFLNQQDKKLYISTKDNVLVSEKLIP